MLQRPKLRSVSAVAAPGRVLIYIEPFERLELADPDGSTSVLLQLLAAGTATVPQLVIKMRDRGYTVSHADVAAGVEALARLGLVQEAEDWSELPPTVLSRHESNLHYYDLFRSATLGAATIHARVTEARVLLLGVGGVGSGILQSLTGAGVGQLRIVDIDVVEEKNLARQFCYGQQAVGRHKVVAAAEWVRSYSPSTRVEAIHERIADAGRVRELAEGATVVVCAIDTPADVQLIVN